MRTASSWGWCSKARRGTISPPAAHRPLGRGLSGDPSLPRWQRPPEPGADHFIAATGRLCLRILQLTRKRDRAEQGGLLPVTEADTRNDQDRVPELATLAGLLPTGTRGAGSSPQPQGRARKDRTCRTARTLATDRRVRTGAWAHHHGRCDPAD